MSLVAKLGGTEMLGQYALAVAIVAPALMLAHLNLRAVLATDVEERHPFGDYLAVRLAVAAAGLAAIALLAWLSAESRPLAAVILATGTAQSSETISDVYYGALQRRERMKPICLSLVARSIVSVALLGLALRVTGDLVWSVAAMALGRVAVLLAYDRPQGQSGEDCRRSGRRSELTILRTALPLGVVLMLVALNTNLPRYAIGHYLGARELGAFAAAVSFVTVGSTVVHALGQAVTPRLARHFSERDWGRFRGISVRLAGVVLALGAAGVTTAAVLGKFALALLYRPEYAAYSVLLVWIMGAAVPGYLAIALGYVVTSARAFHPQMPLFCGVAATCGIASWALVPRFGLRGAALALALAATVQIGGEALILARAIRRGEPA